MSNAISNLINSVFDMINAIVHFFLSIFQGVFDAAKAVIGSALEIVNSIIAGVLHNLVPLAIVAAAIFAFIAFQTNAGGAKSKVNSKTK